MATDAEMVVVVVMSAVVEASVVVALLVPVATAVAWSVGTNVGCGVAGAALASEAVVVVACSGAIAACCGVTTGPSQATSAQAKPSKLNPLRREIPVILVAFLRLPLLAKQRPLPAHRLRSLPQARSVLVGNASLELELRRHVGVRPS